MISLTTNEKMAESDINKSVWVSGTAGKFGIPNVAIVIPVIKLSTIAYSRVLLGLDRPEVLPSPNIENQENSGEEEDFKSQRVKRRIMQRHREIV